MVLVDSGKITARYDEDVVSFYVRDIEMGERPLLTLRLSDHRPNYQKYIRSDALPPSGNENTNVSIEFYKPKYNDDGTRNPNKVKPRVTIKPEIEGVVPFIIYSYSYTHELLNNADVDKIYNSILHWINGDAEIYVDPHKGTSKAAYPQQKTSKIKIKENCNKNMNRNRKHVVRLTESKLRNMIKESVRQILRESNNSWDGDTTPFQNIIDACDEIYDKFKGIYDGDPNDYDPEVDSTICFDILDWVKEVRHNAEYFAHCNRKYQGVGYGDLAEY